MLHAVRVRALADDLEGFGGSPAASDDAFVYLPKQNLVFSDAPRSLVHSSPNRAVTTGPYPLRDDSRHQGEGSDALRAEGAIRRAALI